MKLRRFVRFGLAMACIAAGWNAAAVLSVLRAQQPTPPVPAKAFSSRGMDLRILGPDGNYAPTARLEGHGVLPVHLLVQYHGHWPEDRQLQVFVAVYEPKSPGSLTPVKLLTTWLSPDILQTPAGPPNVARLDHELPLQPGPYVYQVFLCDPTEPVGKAEDLPWWKEAYMPALEKFPGMVYKFQVGRALVH